MSSIYRGFVNRDNMAWFDGGPYRVLKVVGPDAFGISEDFVATDAASDVIPGWTATLVEAGAGESTVTVDKTSGGHLVLTTDANDNDGVNIQLDGQAFECTTGQAMTYFGIKFAVSDAEQTDFLVGLCGTDTTLLAGLEEGIYFESLDGSAAISFVSEKVHVEQQSDTLGTLVDATDIVLEFYWDGTTAIALIDGVVVATHATTIPSLTLTPSIHFLNGAVGAETMTIDWVRAFQVGR